MDLGRRVRKPRGMSAARGSNHEDLQHQAHDHLLLHFARNGGFVPEEGNLLVLERAEGPYVYDTSGKQYIDALSSLFCAQIGYSYGHEMAAAAAEQLTTLAFNTNWATAHPAAIRLAAKLAEVAPGDLNRAFFTSGGSESVEAAWKLARQYHLSRGEPQRTKAIARRIAYHGVTLGALSFTAVEGMKEPFGPPAIPVRHVSATNAFRAHDGNDEAAFCARLLQEVEDTVVSEGPDTIAMIIAEPVQNAGGCLVPPKDYWRGLREIADRHGILLAADEVICAFGRLGEWFGSQRVGARPDLLTTAKGITSAYAPMGAVLVSDRVAEPLYAEGATLLHGVTFGASHLGIMAALSALAPEAARGRAQGVLGAALALAMAGTTALSGVVFRTAGAHVFLAMVPIAAAGLVFALLAARSLPQPQRSGEGG